MKVLNRKAVDRATRFYNSMMDIDAYIKVATIQAMGDVYLTDREYEHLFDDVKIIKQK